MYNAEKKQRIRNKHECGTSKKPYEQPCMASNLHLNGTWKKLALGRCLVNLYLIRRDNNLKTKKQYFGLASNYIK